MKKAFLFDMDGVIVNSEQLWLKDWEEFSSKLYGKEIAHRLGDTTGISVDHEYEMAAQYGFSMDKEKYLAFYDQAAFRVYHKARITKGLKEILVFLKKNNFLIGIVTSSRKNWMNVVLAEIPYRELFDYTLSLNEAKIPSKPLPDGYLHAMKALGVTPENTIILEDSNSGIRAGKASGAFTIAYTELLVKGYHQIPADATAHSMKEVEEIVKKRIS